MPMTAAGGSKAAESGDHDLLARAIDKISSLELELTQLKISKGNAEPTPTPANSHRSVGTTPAPVRVRKILWSGPGIESSMTQL